MSENLVSSERLAGITIIAFLILLLFPLIPLAIVLYAFYWVAKAAKGGTTDSHQSPNGADNTT